MSQSEPQGVHTSDRRRERRDPSDDRVTVTLDSGAIQGQASNLSKTGILFFTDEEVKVEVTLTDPEGNQRTERGNLVRCERIKGNHRGWAVEFDHD